MIKNLNQNINEIVEALFSIFENSYSLILNKGNQNIMSFKILENYKCCLFCMFSLINDYNRIFNNERLNYENFIENIALQFFNRILTINNDESKESKIQIYNYGNFNNIQNMNMNNEESKFDADIKKYSAQKSNNNIHSLRNSSSRNFDVKDNKSDYNTKTKSALKNDDINQNQNYNSKTNLFYKKIQTKVSSKCNINSNKLIEKSKQINIKHCWNSNKNDSYNKLDINKFSKTIKPIENIKSFNKKVSEESKKQKIQYINTFNDNNKLDLNSKEKNHYSKTETNNSDKDEFKCEINQCRNNLNTNNSNIKCFSLNKPKIEIINKKKNNLIDKIVNVDATMIRNIIKKSYSKSKSVKFKEKNHSDNTKLVKDNSKSNNIDNFILSENINSRNVKKNKISLFKSTISNNIYNQSNVNSNTITCENMSAYNILDLKKSIGVGNTNISNKIKRLTNNLPLNLINSISNDQKVNMTALTNNSSKIGDYLKLKNDNNNSYKTNSDNDKINQEQEIILQTLNSLDGKEVLKNCNIKSDIYHKIMNFSYNNFYAEKSEKSSKNESSLIILD